MSKSPMRSPAPTFGDYASVLELAAELGCSPYTLNRWRRLGIGPPYIKRGPRFVLYHREAVREWLKARVVLPPRDPAYRRPGRPRKHVVEATTASDSTVRST
jgi:hypothetical protein